MSPQTTYIYIITLYIIYQSTNQSTNQSIDQSTNQPTNQSINQSINQSTNDTLKHALIIIIHTFFNNYI